MPKGKYFDIPEEEDPREKRRREQAEKRRAEEAEREHGRLLDAAWRKHGPLIRDIIAEYNKVVKGSTKPYMVHNGDNIFYGEGTFHVTSDGTPYFEVYHGRSFLLEAMKKHLPFDVYEAEKEDTSWY